MVQPLQQLFRSQRRVLVGTCSATGFMEMAVRSGVRQRALSLVSGAFGERFAAIVAASGRDVVRLNVSPGQTVEPGMLHAARRRADGAGGRMVHSGPSTGALAPLEALGHVMRQPPDVLLLVDA